LVKKGQMLKGTKFIQKKRANLKPGKYAPNIILKIACFLQERKIVFGGFDITVPFYLCGTFVPQLSKTHAVP